MFTQKNLTKSINSQSGVFDSFIYRTNDVDTDLLAPDYFKQSRYIDDPGWPDGIISIIRDKDFYLYRISKNGQFVTHLSTDKEKLNGGSYSYEDVATKGTAITYTGGSGLMALTNDAAGTQTTNAYSRKGIPDIWSPDQFDFSSLNLGDMVDICIDIFCVTTVASQDIKIILESGSSQILFTYEVFGATGTYQLKESVGLTTNSQAIITNPAYIKIESTGTLFIVVNNWYCRVFTRG